MSSNVVLSSVMLEDDEEQNIMLMVDTDIVNLSVQASPVPKFPSLIF